MTAFYPGAGLDISPIVLCPHIEKWFYMDIQPCVEKPFFIHRLGKIMKQIGFECISYHNNTLLFMESNGKRTVTYYTNSTFPDDMYKYLISATTLVVRGFSLPNAPLLFYKQWEHVIIDSNMVSIKDTFITEKISIIVHDNVEYVEEDQTITFIKEHASIKNDFV